MTDPASGVDEQATFDDLFAVPPRSEAELRARLAAIDPARGRRRLLERLGDVGAPPRESATMVGALSVLGVGPEDLPALGQLLLDATAARSGRAVALALLGAIDPARAEQLARRLSPDDLMALNDAQLTAVIASMPTTPSRVVEISRKLARQPEGARTIRLGQIERIRRRLAIPAALLYRDALGRDDLGLDGPLIELVVEEGGVGAAILFEQRAEACSGAAAEARWAAALARLYQAEGRPKVEIPRAEAWIGELAEGTTALVLGLTSAVDGSLTIASARLAGEPRTMRDGAVVSLASARELSEILGQLGSAVKAGLGEVAAAVEAAARTTRAGRRGAELSSDAFAALCYFGMAGRFEAR